MKYIDCPHKSSKEISGLNLNYNYKVILPIFSMLYNYKNDKRRKSLI